MLFYIYIMIILGIISGYVITSFILLKYPRLIHKRKEIAFKAQHISHRGGAGENIENTIDAFKHAVSVGTQMLEIDCHLTKDGEVVVCHDGSLLRLTGVNTTISETNYKDLPLLSCKLHLDFAYDHVTETENKELEIPLLQQVFENFPQIPINIDVKDDNDELIKKISELIKRYNREKITVWGSGFKNVCQKCYATNKNIPLFFSMKRVISVFLLFYLGLLPFVPIRESFYEICMFSIFLEKGRLREPVKKKWRFFIKVADFLIMNRLMFKHLQDRGIQVYLWVLNNDSEYQRALDYNVSGIITDYPTKLKEFLEIKNMILDTNAEN